MSKTQRIILALYCLLVVYCCIWIPWHVRLSASIEAWYAGNFKQVGYGWLWAGPEGSGGYSLYATPDVISIGLRLLASSALAGAAFLIAGIARDSISSTSR